MLHLLLARVEALENAGVHSSLRSMTEQLDTTAGVVQIAVFAVKVHRQTESLREEYLRSLGFAPVPKGMSADLLQDSSRVVAERLVAVGRDDADRTLASYAHLELLATLEELEALCGSEELDSASPHQLQRTLDRAMTLHRLLATLLGPAEREPTGADAGKDREH